MECYKGGLRIKSWYAFLIYKLLRRKYIFYTSLHIECLQTIAPHYLPSQFLIRAGAGRFSAIWIFEPFHAICQPDVPLSRPAVFTPQGIKTSAGRNLAIASHSCPSPSHFQLPPLPCSHPSPPVASCRWAAWLRRSTSSSALNNHTVGRARAVWQQHQRAPPQGWTRGSEVGPLCAGARGSGRFLLPRLQSPLCRSTPFLLLFSSLQACACVLAAVYLPCALIGRSLASKSSIIFCLYFCASSPFGIGDFCHLSGLWWTYSFSTSLLYVLQVTYWFACSNYSHVPCWSYETSQCCSRCDL